MALALDMESLGYSIAQLQSNPLRNFRPNQGQLKAIALMTESKAKIKLIKAANAVGKTSLFWSMVAAICWPGENGFFDHELFTRWPYPKAIRYISTLRNLADDVGGAQKAIDRLFPRARFESEKGKAGYRSKIRTDSGFVIELLTNHLDPKEYAGGEFGLIGFDEPFHRNILNENQARTRSGGFVLILVCPVSDPGTEAADLVWMRECLEEGDEYDCETLQLDFESNCLEHGKPGFIPHEDLLGAVQGFPEDEWRARLYGDWCLTGGRVHESWARNHERILIEPYDFRRWMNSPQGPPTLYMALDPHESKPFVMLWFAMFQSGRGEFVAEYPDDCYYHRVKNCSLGLEDYVKIVDRIESHFPVPVFRRLIDKHYGNQRVRHDNLHESIKIGLWRLSKGKLIFNDNPGGNHSWREARVLLESKFRPDKETNKPLWRCFNTLVNLQYAMERHVLSCRSGVSAERHGDLGQPTDKHKCFPNCVEWLALADPQWYPLGLVAQEPTPRSAPATLYARMTGDY